MPRNARNTKAKCLTCPNDATYCGLCDKCRQAAYRAIKSGKATREQLEKKQLILPSRRGRRMSPWAQKAETLLSH